MSTEDNRTWNPVGWFEIYVTDMDRAKAFSAMWCSVTLPLPRCRAVIWKCGSLRLNAGPKGPLAG